MLEVFLDPYREMAIKAGHMALLRTEKSVFQRLLKIEPKDLVPEIASDFPSSRNLTTEIQSYW